jgi:hypothetical protein
MITNYGFNLLGTWNYKRKYSYCQNDRILGGLLVFSQGSIRRDFTNLDPHYEVRIIMRMFLLDAWTSTDNVKVNVDSNTI